QFHGSLFRLDDRSIGSLPKSELRATLSDPNSFVWVDIQARDVRPLNDLLYDLGIDIVVGRHFEHPAVLPRLCEHPHCLVFYLYEVKDPLRHLNDSSELCTMQPNRLILVLGDGFVLTYHRDPVACIDYVERRSKAVFRFEGSGPGFIAY